MAAIQTDPQYKLRLPADLKAWIEIAAKNNNRSMNAEIVARLLRTFDDETKPHLPWLDERATRAAEFGTSRAMPIIAADIARIIEETSRTAARLTVEQMQKQYGVTLQKRDSVLARLQAVVDVIEEQMRESVAAEAKGAMSQLSSKSFKDRIKKLDTNVLVDMVSRIEGALEQTPNLLNATPQAIQSDPAAPSSASQLTGRRALDLDDKPAVEEQPAQPGKSRRLLPGLEEDTAADPISERPGVARRLADSARKLIADDNSGIPIPDIPLGRSRRKPNP